MNQGFNGNFPRPMFDPTLINSKQFKRWAQGSLTISTNGQVTVTGLSFTPTVLFFAAYYSSAYHYVYTMPWLPAFTSSGMGIPNGTQWFNLSGGYGTLSAPVSFFQGGFSLSFGTSIISDPGAYIAMS